MELVVGASEATMKSLLGKLGNLLAQEYGLIRGVRGDVQYMNDELASMQAFLCDLSVVAEGHSHDQRRKDWMKQIRDIAYDIEDCIDGFAHRLPQDSNSDAKCSFLLTKIYELWTWWPRREIASSIAELKVRAQQIADRRSRYGVNNPEHLDSSSSARTRAVTYEIAEYQVTIPQIIGIKEPVGMETVMEQLEVWLTNPQAQNGQSVLSIVGFGGVGKTTIATALYRKVGDKFQCRASVAVSQNYDQGKVLSSILSQVIVYVSQKTALSLLTGNCICQPENDGNPDNTTIRLQETTDDDQNHRKLEQLLDEKRYSLRPKI